MDLIKALKILELGSYNGPEDLKKAFRALAHRHHPDKNPGEDTAALFGEVMTAYQYCSQNLDEVSRHFGVKIDPNRSAAERIVIENLDDIFEDILGFSRNGRVLGYEKPQPVYLSVREFLCGGTKIQKLLAGKTCSQCGGAGCSKGTLARICRHCFGKGFYHRRSLGREERKICPQCKGRGREMERPCEHCEGFGRVRRRHKQRLNLPLGLKPGGIYTLTGYDLVLNTETEIFVEACLLRDGIFQIENYDLICEYHMDFSKHNWDQTFNFATPLGLRPVVVLASAKPGDIVTIRGAGLYLDSGKSGQGDLRVILRHKPASLWRRIFGGFFEKK